MDKDSITSKETDVVRRKRKNTSKTDEKKSRGKRKKKDNSSENIESNQSREKKKDCESPSASRPTSPDPNCSICLGDLQNKSFTDSCFHMFCFVCLKEWSKVKAECPLCKQKFQNIIYNVRSYEKYDRYNIEEEANRNQYEYEHDMPRFRYRTTLTFERRFTIGPEHNYTQPIARPTSITTRSQWRRQRQPATSDFRRRVYRNGMRALEVRDRRLRTREVNPEYFRGNPAQMHRLVPWLNRELNSLLENLPERVQLVMELVMGIIKSYPIDSEEFFQHVYPYVGRNTRHFMHEFLTFAKSPYNMPAYDSHVSYTAGAFSVDTDSNDSSSDYGDDDDVEEIIDIEDEREREVERQRNIPIEGMTDLRPLFRSVRDILETDSPGNSTDFPLSMSRWDSPTPGPSWASMPSEFDILSATSPSMPVIGNRESSPIDIGSSDTDSDSTISAESDTSDVVFVKMDKAWDERSPIMLSSDDADDEVKRSQDFINRHYSKKKSRLKKKEHKKHKEHKRHEREKSKERHRHKKHKKHHSSDKSHRQSHSSSKHRDSERATSKHRDSERSRSQRDSEASRSPSKHREHGRSGFKSSEADHSRSSVSSDRHHKKKHKKYKHENKRKKSSSRGKLPSVIVLPNSSVEDQTSQAIPCISCPVLPVCSSSGSSSTSNISDGVQKVEPPCKKHSSGHKRSSKLDDIVPKLLEKGLDKITIKSRESESTSGKNRSCTTSSYPPNLTQTSQNLVSFKVSNSLSRTVDSVVSCTRTANLVKPSVPFHIPDNILSLENSRQCLKCRLLYIPELLDSFDVCVTCKKKKVCETESRNFSDVFHELTRNQNTSSLPARNNETKELKRNSFITSHAENIVIQEGNESSLRPVLNQIDLTSVDALIESDNDDCELILANSVIDMACIDNDPKKSLATSSKYQQSSPLHINLSNPPTPMSNQMRTTLLPSQSPHPWSHDVSNPQITTSNDWLSYMAPSYSRDFPTTLSHSYLFPKNTCMLEGVSSISYPNIDLRSSVSPMSCSSLYFDSFGSQSKPLMIDLDNGFVDLEKEDCQSKTATSMSVCSTENICLSDSDDSEKSLKIDESDRISTQSYEVRNLLNDTHENDSLNKDQEIYTDNNSLIKVEETDNENNSFNAEIDIIEEQKKSTEKYKYDGILDTNELISKLEDVDQDIEMALKSSSYKSVSHTREDNNDEENLTKNIEYESNENDVSHEIEKHVPTSLAEKLNGLTDFTPSILKGLENGKGLSFHDIISANKQNVSRNEVCDIFNDRISQTNDNLDSNSVDDFDSNLPDYLLIDGLDCQQNDALVVKLPVDENISRMDKNEDEMSMSCSATMNSMESDNNSYSTLNEKSENMILSSSITMEPENLQKIDMLCDSVASESQSFPLLDSNAERLTLISTVNDWITDNQIQKGDNQSTSFDGINLDLEETCDKLGTNNDKQLTISDDHQDSSDNHDNYIDSCETEFDSTDTDLDICLSEEAEDASSNIESFRVDILHTERDLSDNFSRIFESSDSN